METMVFALWIAALFLVVWQVVISVQFSRMSSELHSSSAHVEEGWNYEDLEEFCSSIAREMIETESSPDSSEWDSQYPYEVHYAVQDAPISGEYIMALENRIQSLESLLEHQGNELANMSAGHFTPHVTQYGHHMTDGHGFRPVEVNGSNWSEPVRLRRVR